MFKKIFCFITFVIICLCFTACGSTSESDLKEMLPDTLTSYEMDNEIHNQDIENINIIKRNTDSDNDFIECEITLKDEYFERIIYVDLYLTNYETGGWMIDSIEPYANETITILHGPDDTEIDNYLSEYGYPGLKQYQDETDHSDGQKYIRHYSLDESHQYADFKGTLTYIASLHKVYGNDYYDYPSFSWDESIDISQMDVDWKIEGTWTITGTGDLPTSSSITIDSVDNDNVVASGSWQYPIYSFEANGHTGEYQKRPLYLSKVITNDEDSPQPKLTLKFHDDIYSVHNEYLNITFEPDNVSEGKPDYYLSIPDDVTIKKVK